MITEKHLHFALEVHRLSEENTPLFDIATDAILIYAAHNLEDDLSDENICNYAKNLVADHLINHMITAGLIEEDYDGHLSLTAEGEEIAMSDDC